MENSSSAAETSRQQLGACSVVHVAAAQPPFRVDSTSRLIPGSPDSDDGVGDGAPPSVADRVPPSTMTATSSCARDTELQVGCCNSSGVGLPAVAPQRGPGVATPSYGETTAKLNACNSSTSPSAVNHDAVKHITSDASPIRAGGGGNADTVADDMVTCGR